MLPPVLIAAMMDADEREFMITLYDQYYYIMFAVSYGILRDRDYAEDAVSAVVEKLIGKVSTLMDIDRAALKSYIVSATRNTALTIAVKDARKLKRFAFYFDSETENGIPAQDDVEFSVLRQETVRRMADALECLPERDREILRMKYFDEMTDQEIAEVIRTKASTVRSYLTRARNKLLAVCKERRIEL